MKDWESDFNRTHVALLAFAWERGKKGEPQTAQQVTWPKFESRTNQWKAEVLTTTPQCSARFQKKIGNG
jgi:hypothetical protein